MPRFLPAAAETALCLALGVLLLPVTATPALAHTANSQLDVLTGAAGDVEPDSDADSGADTEPQLEADDGALVEDQVEPEPEANPSVLADSPDALQMEAENGRTDEQHADEDLVGTSMEAIEQETATNARRIEKETGTIPGQVDGTAEVEKSVESAAVAGDPGRGGAWSQVFGTPVVPVFQALLPNGRVLMWDSVGDGPTESYARQNFTRAMVWNPVTNTSKRVDVKGYNIFCAGFTQLSDGNVLVAGGNKNQALAGIVQTHIFNWRTETWSRGPNMASGRWYPSVTALANGEASIIGGGPKTAEVFQVNRRIRKLTNFTKYGARLYPFVLSRPDSDIALVGPYNSMYTVDTARAGKVIDTAKRDTIKRDYGSFATYGIGKTLVAGGGTVNEGGKTRVPTRTALVVDTNGGLRKGATGPMSVGRRQFNLTVLADGSVLATGGISSSVHASVDLKHPVLAAEQWNPSTGRWTVLASAKRIRQYHSAAVLLPDGRVLTGGGGICGACKTAGYLEKNVEYFTPPYLYKRDGSGQPAPRPVIGAVPGTINFNSRFNLPTPQAAGIRKVGLVRLGAPTHGVDQSQRYIPLSFTRSGTTLKTLAPPNGGVAPPGYYMLFITDAAGVPSVAKVVRVVKGRAPVGTTIKGVRDRCIDVPHSNVTNGKNLWIYNCNGSRAQVWTAVASDRSIRALDKCMDVDRGRFKSGTKVQIWNCNGTKNQKWVRRSDHTIRPAAKTSLCLAVVGKTTKNKAGLELRKCKKKKTAQKWNW